MSSIALTGTQPAGAADVTRRAQKESGGPWTWLRVIFYIYLLLLAVGLIGGGFKWVSGGTEGVRSLFQFATNPFMGLIMGTMATALIQSSSTVTSVIVALCAGGMPVSIGVPMVMGANIGTTITNTLVSLGHIGDSEEFGRAFSAATVHDFFNVISVIIFLPLEIMFHPLERSAEYLSGLMLGGSSVNMGDMNFLKPIIKPVTGTIQEFLALFPHPVGAVLMILLGLAFIFMAIVKIGRLLKKVLIGKAKDIFQAAIGRGPLTGIASGTAVTVLVQSSSTTTSLVVPLAGAGIIDIKKVYTFALGANIGTCITALLASTSVIGAGAMFALQIALVHFIYNLVGVIAIYGFPLTRYTPVVAANWLAKLAIKNRIYAMAYIGTMFFLVPALCMGVFFMLEG